VDASGIGKGRRQEPRSRGAPNLRTNLVPRITGSSGGKASKTIEYGDSDKKSVHYGRVFLLTDREEGKNPTTKRK